MAKFLRKAPDSLIIVSVILVLFTMLTWIIPAGEFDRTKVTLEDGRTKEIVVAGSFHEIPNEPQGFWELLTAPLNGFKGAAEIIAFVLLVGGAFSMLTATGAFDAFFFRVLRFAEKRPGSKALIIALLMTVFSFGGLTFGMSEETLVFALITLPLARSMGYDNIVGVAIPFVGAGAGFAGAAYNPFTVGIAQGIAEIPMFSGAGYRLIVWSIFTLIAIGFVLWYARRIDKKKIAPFTSNAGGEVFEVEEHPLTSQRKIILILFLVALVAIALGASIEGWYIGEICAVFVTLGIAACVIQWMSATVSIEAFYSGVRAMIPAAIIIAMSKGILVLAQDGKILDSILNAMANSVEGLPKAVSVQIMFIVQGALNFFIPSGSGQAAVTMPIMAPFSDLVGISRQTAVLAYQFGDGLFNLIIPTSGVTMGVLAIGGIPFNVWIKWIWKLMLVLILVSMIFLILPVSVFEWQ